MGFLLMGADEAPSIRVHRRLRRAQDLVEYTDIRLALDYGAEARSIPTGGTSRIDFNEKDALPALPLQYGPDCVYLAPYNTQLTPKSIRAIVHTHNLLPDAERHDCTSRVSWD
ncbi:hypothetical protein AB8A05_03975 [Tardiphaga sp. 538_B7_N1_4]|uniref:hypothetical protein n=1 Tax=Tardiphaga sp. 538_B7_N1_4 TaxID=3240778 RepID=UPI003F2983C5